MAGAFNWNEQGKFDAANQARDHSNEFAHKQKMTSRRTKRFYLIGIGIVAFIVLSIALVIYMAASL